MTKKVQLLAVLSLSLCLLASQLNATNMTIEEARVERAKLALGESLGLSGVTRKVLDDNVAKILAAKGIEDAISLARIVGHGLWQAEKQNLQTGSFDDRRLYWRRLEVKRLLRDSHFKFKISPIQFEALLESFEMASRGHRNHGSRTASTKTTDKRILVTGFDPFLLDKNMEQSNPSGVVAMMLDGKNIQWQGETAEIEAFIVPVRFEDFDQGEIEIALADYYRDHLVDMVVTVSMGRDQFDLERFPGLRRSAIVPGNLNHVTGASREQPLVPTFASLAMVGPEFVEFSLPAEAMSRAPGEFEIRINANVETLEKGGFEAERLADIVSQTSVNGSGGGYLSNEISYRSINLRQQLKSDIPTGHIHTPKVKVFDAKVIQSIVEQVEAMLQRAIPEI